MARRRAAALAVGRGCAARAARVGEAALPSAESGRGSARVGSPLDSLALSCEWSLQLPPGEWLRAGEQEGGEQEGEAPTLPEPSVEL